MTYRLKEIHYLTRRVSILLQNENGPCPLLAAANCLLLRDLIQFSPLAKDHGFVTLDDLINMLAEFAVNRNTATQSSTFHMEELLEHLPRFQYGMAYEYTAELTAFDMLGVSLVHGWVVDPSSPHAEALGTLSYNQVTDTILHGQTAFSELTLLETRLEQDELTEPQKQELQNEIQSKQLQVQKSRLMEEFLAESSHQLTLTGLSQLLTETIPENKLFVFFRNNHYGVITKHGESLFLLITDCGYGESPDVVWERLDMVDGDTELCNADFTPPRRAPEVLATTPVDIDFEMALQLSAAQQEHTGATVAMGVPVRTPEQQREASDRMLAMQLQQQQQPVPDGTRRTVVSNDAALARQMQQRESARQQRTATTASNKKECRIM